MLSLDIFLLLMLITYSLAKECDRLGILIYEDLGCTPEYDKNEECPKKYVCKGMEPSNDHCYFRGKSYAVGEIVNDNLTYPSCDIGCFCSPLDNISHFQCAVLDCPDWLGAPNKPGCHVKYSLDSCCSVGLVCPEDNSEKCVVEGKEYREGERFYPNNTCFTCVCRKGFKGKFEEPFCKRSLCGQQLSKHDRSFQSACAPFYTRDLHKEVLCCPNDWICSDGTEIIQGEVRSEETCKFGNRVIKVGQYVEKSNVKDAWGKSFSNVKCECVIPPLMRCMDV